MSILININCYSIVLEEKKNIKPVRFGCCFKCIISVIVNCLTIHLSSLVWSQSPSEMSPKYDNLGLTVAEILSDFSKNKEDRRTENHFCFEKLTN